MLFLLRKIRRKLISTDNKVITYLLYAAGEILLVVAGILIAVSIDNWNEARKEQMVEGVYLTRLKQDLEKDLVDLETEINYRKDKMEVAKKMTAEFHGLVYSIKRPISDQYAQMLIYTWSQFYPNNHTFEELLSTGQLNLIRNDSIKSACFELQKQWIHLDREYKTINELRLRYIIDRSFSLGSSASSILAVYESDTTLKISDNKRRDLKQENIQKENRVRNDIGFQNAVSTEILLNSAIINLIEAYRLQVEKTLRFIRNE